MTGLANMKRGRLDCRPSQAAGIACARINASVLCALEIGCTPRSQRSTSGFTLVEILLALAITVVFTAIVCAGIPAAWRTYTDSVDASNAQVLLSTTTTTLRNELNRATNVDDAASHGARIAFDTGEGYRVTLDGSKNGIEKVTAAYTVDGDGERVPGASSSPTYLLADATRTESLGITFASISFDKEHGVFSISGLEVKRGNDVIATVGTSDGTFKVKTISSEVRNDG